MCRNGENWIFSDGKNRLTDDARPQRRRMRLIQRRLNIKYKGGTVKLPKALVPYCGFEVIKRK
jgi:hypothetical protein